MRNADWSAAWHIGRAIWAASLIPPWGYFDFDAPWLPRRPREPQERWR